MKYIVLSGASKKPQLFTERLQAVQAMDAALYSVAGSGAGRGSAAIRQFLEGSVPSITWGDYRLDTVETK